MNYDVYLSVNYIEVLVSNYNCLKASCFDIACNAKNYSQSNK